MKPECQPSYAAVDGVRGFQTQTYPFGISLSFNCIKKNTTELVSLTMTSYAYM